MKHWTSWTVAIALCTGSLPSEAHKPSDSYLTLSQAGAGATLDGQWDIALRDLQHAVGLDANGDGAITWGELKSRRSAVTKYVVSRLAIEAIARGDRERAPIAFEAASDAPDRRRR